MSRKKLTYAGRLERLLAYLIDTIILAIASLPLVALFPSEDTNDIISGPNDIMSENPLVTLSVFLMTLAYYTYFTASDWQATPGKRILSLYVVRTNRRKLTPRDALERFLAFIIPTLPFYASFIPERVAAVLATWLVLFWFAPIVFSIERTGYHDTLCRTRVVVGRAKT